MKNLRGFVFFVLSVGILSCVFLGAPSIVMASDDNGEEEMAGIMVELKQKVEGILWWSDPEKWHVIPYKYKWLKGQPVWCFIDECGYGVVLAKDETEEWMRISGGGDYTGMNKVLEKYVISKDELDDTPSLIKFIYAFQKLYFCFSGDVLSKRNVEYYSSALSNERPEENVDDLKALCVGPEAKINNECLTITFNYFTALGSVESWTIIGKHVDDHVTVEKVSICMLKPIGSLVYDIL